MMRGTLVEFGIVGFIIYALISVASVLNIWRTNVATHDFLTKIERSLNGALSGFEGLLRNARRIATDISTVPEEVRRVIDRVPDPGSSLRECYCSMKTWAR